MRWERGCLAVILPWSWAVGGYGGQWGAMEDTEGLGGTSLSCPLPSPASEHVKQDGVVRS